MNMDNNRRNGLSSSTSQSSSRAKLLTCACEGPGRCTGGECELCCHARRNQEGMTKRRRLRNPCSLLNPAATRQPPRMENACICQQLAIYQQRITTRGVYAGASTSIVINHQPTPTDPAVTSAPSSSKAGSRPSGSDQIHQDQDSAAALD